MVMSVFSKLTSMSEAVSRLVQPGTSLVMGAALEAAIPFAVGHEIIRQGLGDLVLIGPISDALFDMLIGSGVVNKVIAAWVGNVGTGLGYNFRRAVELGQPRPLVVEDHSNLTVATALDAAGMGLTFGLARSLFGTDILANNPNLTPITCPFTGTRHLAVKAIQPDLAVIHVQRADANGNSHLWGNWGIVPEAVRASRQVLVVAEEIVDPLVIRSDPNRTIIPGFKVAAVVHEPWGAHPSPVQGYYGHDDRFYVDYAAATRTADLAQTWLKEWVLQVPDRAAYLRKLGRERLKSLQVKISQHAAPVDYGY